MNVVWDLVYFWDVCPYTHDELRKRNRKRDIVYWRQVGMYVGRQSGMSLEGIGSIFNLNHATVIHGLKQIDITLEGYNHVQDAMIQKYISRAPRMADVKNIESTSEVCVNEMIGLTIMEGMQASRP
jgi:hypothetical protein